LNGTLRCSAASWPPNSTAWWPKVLADSALGDGRRRKSIRQRLIGVLRQAVHGRLAGCEDVSDAWRLAHDLVTLAMIGHEGMDLPAAATGKMGRGANE
jgi:hypothetical protein